jgi:HAD superfamily hydrolase (TIGR01549 family)
MSRPRVIFFDMGQTLVTGAAQSTRRLVASGLALSEKETRKVGRLMMTHPATELSSLIPALKGILVDHEQRHIENILEAIWEEQVRCVKEIDGATAALRLLKAKGFKLGLLSTTWHPLFEGFCRSCPEMAELLDLFVLSYRLGCKKPSPGIFHQALEQAGAPAEKCWMVGDSYELDVEPALAAGMRTIWVLRSPEREKALLAQVLRGEKDRPESSVVHLDEILEFFASKGWL